MIKARRILAILSEEKVANDGSLIEGSATVKEEQKVNDINKTEHQDEKFASEEVEEDWDSWDPMTEDYVSSKNTLALDPDRDPTSIFMGRRTIAGDQIGGKKICEHFAKYGNCADGQYCDRLHIDPKIRGKIWALQESHEFNRQKGCLNYTFLSSNDLKPDPDLTFLVSITNINSPIDFHFVIPYEKLNFSQFTQEDMKFYIDNESKCPAKIKLREYHEQMAAVFEHNYRVDNLEDEIFLGQIVACKLENGRYRRAMVVDRPDYSMDQFKYTLKLLDLGGEVDLPRERIYDIDARCLSDPPLAINARLCVRLPKGHMKWSQEACEFLTKEVCGRDFLLCKIVDQDNLDKKFFVELYDPITRKSISEKLIDAGLASNFS